MTSAEPIDVDDPEVDGDLAGRVTYRGELFTGQTVEHDTDGKRIALTTYTAGIQDGPSREWYPDGRPLMDGMVKSGRAVGEWREWYPDGRLKQLDVFDDSGNHLSRTVWDEDGNPVNSTTRS